VAVKFDQNSLISAYIDACECELKAFKPGNVSDYSEGHGMTCEDFRISASISAAPLVDTSLTLGEKIYRAIEATWSAVGCNTNLGIVLLCAPLIQAMQIENNAGLRSRLSQVLSTTTIQDADWVYKSIRLAKPAGIGESSAEDISKPPKVSLLEAMRIAADRDRVAYQYISDYTDVFEFAKNRYHVAVGQWDDRIWAAVSVYIGLLRRFPDSHIERKYGSQFTRMVTTRMAFLEKELSKTSNPELIIDCLHEVDSEFKNAGINPGTTADLTVATVLAVNLETLLSKNAVHLD